MGETKNKLVMVTGASAGIGEACARRFAARGDDLILIARRLDRLKRLKETIEGDGGNAVHIGGIDVRDRAVVESLCDDLRKNGRVPDVLVNNAGLSRGLTKFFEGSPDDWDEMIDTNIKGLLNITRGVAPMMVERDSGHIVNIGSIAGRTVYPGGNVYNATKFAVRALNQAMNIDLVGTRIRVSSIDPGATRTEFSEVRFHGDKDRAAAVYEGFRPLSAEDIADAVLYVVSAPAHVNIAEMVVLPTAQRSPYVVHIDGGAERKR